MFALGILAVLQVCFIPGFLLISALGLRYPLSTNLILSFFLSVTLNYVIVLGLVTTGGLAQAYVELLFLTGLVCAAGLAVWRYRINRAPRARITLLESAVVGVAAVVAIYIIRHAYASPYSSTYFGTVPHHWDAVVSWNRWALDWAGGHVARQSWGYGQLIPAAWAMTYAFLGTTEIELFAKVVSDVFPAFFWLPLVDLFLRTRRVEYLAAGIFSFAFLHSPIAMWLFSGNADAPLAAIVLGAIYAILLLETVPANDRAKHLAVIAVITGGCALLKQQGMLVVAVMPLLILGIYGSRSGISWRQLAVATAVAGAVSLSWYGIWAWRLLHGLDISNVMTLIADRSLHHDASIAGRFAQGWHMWLETTRREMTFYALLPGLILSMFDRRLRWVAAVLLVPYSLIWAVGFSYDVRNALMIIPLWCLVAAGGWVALARWLWRAVLAAIPVAALIAAVMYRQRYLRELPLLATARLDFFLRAGACAVTIAVLSVYAGIATARMSDAHLRELQAKAELTKGEPPVTKFLVRLAANGRLNGSVLTNYQVLHYVHLMPGPEVTFRFLRNEAELKGALDSKPFRYLAIWKGGTDSNFFLQLRQRGIPGFVALAEDEGVLVLAAVNASAGRSLEP